MSGNRLLSASLVLVALLALTLFLFHQRDSEDARPSDVVVKLPKLTKDTIDALEVSVPGKTSVKLAKKDKIWQLSSPLQAAADPSAVDAALSKLGEIEVVGVAATQADNHKMLEVDDAQATHVVVSQAGKVIADLMIGAYRNGNTMLREKGSKTVATVKGSIKYAFDKELREWRDRGIVEVAPEKVKTATFQNANGNFRFEQDAGVWKQSAGDKAIAGFDVEQLKAIVGSATSLQATDFAPEGAASPQAPAGQVVLRVDGDPEVITLNVGPKQDEGYHLTREGNPTLFIVSAFVGERLLPSADKFAPPPAAAPEGAAPAGKPAAVAKAPKAAKAAKAPAAAAP